jgi:hypothetical protein
MHFRKLPADRPCLFLKGYISESSIFVDPTSFSSGHEHRHTFLDLRECKGRAFNHQNYTSESHSFHRKNTALDMQMRLQLLGIGFVESLVSHSLHILAEWRGGRSCTITSIERRKYTCQFINSHGFPQRYSSTFLNDWHYLLFLRRFSD